jgi:hypothetical protein
MLSRAECKWREGSKGCIWMAKGCLNREVLEEVKKKCREGK